MFVFSKIHTIKKKNIKKRGWKLWKLPTFQLQNPQKSSKSSSQPNVIQARTTRPAEITSPEPSAAPPLPAEPEAREQETDRVRKSKRQKIPGVWKKRTFFGDFFDFWSFWGCNFSMFFQTSDCIWLWLYLVVFVSTVGGLIMFCALLQPYAPDVTSFIACHLATFVAWLKTCSYQRSFWMKENRGE